jgi:hypothetical protein
MMTQPNRMDWVSVESSHECSLGGKIQLARPMRAGAHRKRTRRDTGALPMRSFPLG